MQYTEHAKRKSVSIHILYISMKCKVIEIYFIADLQYHFSTVGIILYGLRFMVVVVGGGGGGEKGF